MEKKNEILNELQSISPLIAAIGKVNVFTVPEGYFNSISDTVMLSLNENFSAVPTLVNKEDVPDGYFENLSRDFAYICQTLKLDTSLKSLNRNPDRESDFRKYYTNETRDIVGQLYADDIRMLGYTFDRPRPTTA